MAGGFGTPVTIGLLHRLGAVPSGGGFGGPLTLGLLHRLGAAVATPIEPARTSDTDGKRRRVKRWRNADEELTEEEAQYVVRKIAELRRAKSAREAAAAAKEIELALAQAARDEEAAEIIAETIEERQERTTPDYGAALRDLELMADIGRRLVALARQLEFERDDDDAEVLLLS